jgi:hypothetical protein
MGAYPRHPFCQVVCFLAPLAVLLALLSDVCIVSAQITQVYSFEPDLQGFGPNGAGTTVTLDTIGATDGANSMKFDIVQGATFVGALTSDLDPAIGDPPGMEFVLYDLTITEQFPSEPPGFVDAGITIFGSSQPDFPGGQLEGQQAQFFNDQVSLGDLEVGTHEIQMNLFSATHPLTFINGSFNDIFGTEGSGPNDMIPVDFQIYINKSSTAPWTGYIDNIRVGTFETADFDFDRSVDGIDFLQWQRSHLLDDGGDANGDGITNGIDLEIWESQFGGSLSLQGLGGASGGGPAVAVPEPTTIGLACAAMLAFVSVRVNFC